MDEIFPSVDEIQPIMDKICRGRMRSTDCGWDLAECGWDLSDCGRDLWMRSSRMWMRSSRMWMRWYSRMWMRSSRMVRAFDSLSQIRNSPVLSPGNLRRHSRIWGAADEAVLNKVHKKSHKNDPLPFTQFLPTQLLILLLRPIRPYKNGIIMALLEVKDLLTYTFFWLPRYLHHSGVYHT